METTLDKGIQIISDTIELLDDKNNFAYFFVVGAGVSVPEIPTASKIVEICKSKVESRGEAVYQRVLDNSALYASNPSQLYSFWIENAFPNPINRSKFYKELIKNARISSGNLMLAQILQSKAVANTVFTTNFDDKVEQALDIIGSKDVFSSENKADNLAISVNSDEIQIVHVHGTYRFYDIANLSNEISDISGQSEMVSSSQVIRNFLQQKAPIVIGYSGWENDVIMKSIKERLAYPIPYKYIWVCFSRKDYDSLPDWLKNNNNVSIILPPDATNRCNESENDIESVFGKNNGTSNLQIPATLFLSKLIAQLKIAPPKIFVNPYEYFSSMVESTLPGNEDVLHLRHWAQRMKYYAKNETAVELKIKDLEIALIGKDFEKICEIFSEFSSMNLEKQDIQFLSKCISSELLNDKHLIKAVPAKIKLLFSILSFIEANAAFLDEVKEMRQLLSNVVFVSFKKSERKDYRLVLDKVIQLTQNRNAVSLLNTQLAAIGMQSSISDNDDEKLALLDLLLSKIPEDTQNTSLRHKQLVALLFKCELLPEQDAIELLEKAEKIYSEYSLEDSELLLLKIKAELAKKLQDSDMSILWVKECLNALPKYYSKECKFNVLKIVFSISRIKPEQLLKVPDIENKLVEILKIIKECKCKIENCECTIMVAQTYQRLENITLNPKTKLSYCCEILALNDKLPHDCKKYHFTSFLTLSHICRLPAIIVPDEIKVSHLKTMKDMIGEEKDFRTIYFATLNTAITLGNEELYISNFEDDIEILKLNDALSDAVEKYEGKDFSEAERTFRKLIKSNCIDVKNSALTNLAFMVRRGEVTDDTLHFEDLIKDISDEHIFKHMNLLLYYLQKEHFNLSECQKAYNVIKNANTEDVNALLKCWGSENLVGSEERAVGLALINGSYSEDVQVVISSTPDSKYDLDAIKTIIQSPIT